MDSIRHYRGLGRQAGVQSVVEPGRGKIEWPLVPGQSSAYDGVRIGGCGARRDGSVLKDQDALERPRRRREERVQRGAGDIDAGVGMR